MGHWSADVTGVLPAMRPSSVRVRHCTGSGLNQHAEGADGYDSADEGGAEQQGGDQQHGGQPFAGAGAGVALTVYGCRPISTGRMRRVL